MANFTDSPRVEHDSKIEVWKSWLRPFVILSKTQIMIIKKYFSSMIIVLAELKLRRKFSISATERWKNTAPTMKLTAAIRRIRFQQ